MADIDKIAVNNTTYNIKDSTARDSISQGKAFLADSSAIADMDSFVSGVGVVNSSTANKPSSVSATTIGASFAISGANIIRVQLVFTMTGILIRKKEGTGVWSNWAQV